MIKLIHDNSLLDQIWEYWESNELSIDELLKATQNTNDEKTLSEIWHLISLKALSNTKVYAEKALQKNNIDPWIHDNYIFGSGNINLDFNKKCKNNPILFYNEYLKIFPKSIIARRILIESYIEYMQIDKAEREIENCIRDFNDNTSIFDIYKCKIIYHKGNSEKACKELDKIAENNKSYYILLNIAETFTQIGFFELAYKAYEKANIFQKNGNRKIDALVGQINILNILEKYDKIENHIKSILEIYKSDYNIVNGPEIECIKNLQLSIASTRTGK